MPKSQFPKKYLLGLEINHREKVEKSLDTAERILMYSGARLNWVGEYINNEKVNWTLKTVEVDSLTLTGTGPDWNAIILDQAQADPKKLRELLKTPDIRQMFASSQYVDIPILVREEEEKLKILDGMNRTIAAIRDGILQIRAYIGKIEGESFLIIEPHVVYDFIKAFQRGGSEEDFKSGLRFLMDSYSNVKGLLKTRFGSNWVRDENVQRVLNDLLEEAKG